MALSTLYDLVESSSPIGIIEEPCVTDGNEIQGVKSLKTTQLVICETSFKHEARVRALNQDAVCVRYRK